MEALTKDHPEVADAVAYALREVSIHRPANAIRFVAEKLLEFQDGKAAETKLPESDEDSDSDGDYEYKDDDEEAAPRPRGRRDNVFAEPVKVDKDWVAPVVPKSDEAKASIKAIISKNILFTLMDDDQRNIIVDAMEEKKFEKGTTIIKQGDTGDFFYVLMDGECDVHKDGALVFQVKPHMAFGELALMYDAPRAATVTSTTDCVTWAIDRTCFKQVMMGTTSRKREMYEGFLGAVPILETLDKTERLTIADALQPISIKAGEKVVEEGDTNADRFYIVESGELKGTKAGVDAEVCPRLKTGAYFGEIALINDKPRAATITAIEDSKILAMDRAAFIRLMGPMVDVLKRNMEVYARFEEEL